MAQVVRIPFILVERYMKQTKKGLWRIEEEAMIPDAARATNSKILNPLIGSRYGASLITHESAALDKESPSPFHAWAIT